MNVQSIRFTLSLRRMLIISVAAGTLGGCATGSGWLPTSGASRTEILRGSPAPVASGIQIVEVTDAVTRRLLARQKHRLFSETFGAPYQADYVIGAGDVIEVSVWEAPPAMLFGSTISDPRTGSATTRVTTFPEQMVTRSGMITIPFAGQISTGGRNLQQIEAEIARQLNGKANQPQIVVRLIHNETTNVTIVGEVTTSLRMPLTPRGERLLDALAAAGGVRQPINKMTVQVTRGEQVQTLPLETVIEDPLQNVLLHPGDVITALYQPFSFTVLGATGKNEEVNFEAHGISLAQALARAGGLQDSRADAKGVFIFRFEDTKATDTSASAPATTPDGRVPVIYRVNLKDPGTFFVAQSFPMRNKDVMYVANAPAVELQKFLNIVLTAVYPVVNVIPKH